MFRFIVLGLLRQGGAFHGYALMKAYRSRSGIQMSTGTFYRELQHLVADGLVRVVARAPGVDARRTPYEITQSGCEMFDKWLRRPPIATLTSDDELAARTMFLDQTSLESARTVIDAWKEELWLLSKKLERERQMDIQRCANEGVPFSILTLALARRLRHLAGDVDYLDELSNALGTLDVARAGTTPPAASSTKPDERRSGRATTPSARR